jgi:hypothetical protein
MSGNHENNTTQNQWQIQNINDSVRGWMFALMRRFDGYAEVGSARLKMNAGVKARYAGEVVKGLKVA